MRCATSCVLLAVGIPVPMSRNCLIPISAARKRTARARKARLARTEKARFGYASKVRSPSSLSAAKLSFPPSQ